MSKETAEEIRAQLAEVRDENAKIERRLAAIRPAGKINRQGKEREEALARGDVEAVRAMDAEHERLAIESESLRVKADRLHRKHQDARAREAAENAPKLYRAFRAKLDAVEVAQAALREAWVEADAAYKAAWQTRNLAERGGYRPESAPAELVQRAAEVSQGATVGRLRVVSISPNVMAEELGVEPEQKVAA